MPSDERMPDNQPPPGEKDASAISVERFRAEFEAFEGPLDLLLYLIKREEVSIFEVPVSHITDRYLAAIRTMQFFDVNVAAEFLVVAATLMEIKSRTLLPPSPTDEEDDPDDPGAELVRRLLEYKEFKEAAGHLAERAEQQSVKFSRPAAPAPADKPAPAEAAHEPEALLEDLAVWDLMAAFAEVLSQTQLAVRPVEILHSDIPVSTYIEEVLHLLRRADGPVEFIAFFRRECSRTRVVGIFLALLELVRCKLIQVDQAHGRGAHIEIQLSDNPDGAYPTSGPAEPLS